MHNDKTPIDSVAPNSQKPKKITKYITCREGKGPSTLVRKFPSSTFGQSHPLAYIHTVGKCDPNLIHLNLCNTYPIFKRIWKWQIQFFKSNLGFLWYSIKSDVYLIFFNRQQSEWSWPVSLDIVRWGKQINPSISNIDTNLNNNNNNKKK